MSTMKVKLGHDNADDFAASLDRMARVARGGPDVLEAVMKEDPRIAAGMLMAVQEDLAETMHRFINMVALLPNLTDAARQAADDIEAAAKRFLIETVPEDKRAEVEELIRNDDPQVRAAAREARGSAKH